MQVSDTVTTDLATCADPVNFNDPTGLYPCVVGAGEHAELGECEDIPLPARPGPNKFRSAFPKCNGALTEAEEKNLIFIVDHYGEASALAEMSGVNLTWLLGWAAEESGYGKSVKAIKNGNYVNESVPPGGVTGGWKNAVPCPPGASAGWACFSGFYDSVYSALYTEHSTWSYPGQSAPSGLSVINAVVAGNPNASVAEVFQAVANAGFDPVGTSTNAGYGSRIESVTNGVSKRLDCLKKNGYLD